MTLLMDHAHTLFLLFFSAGALLVLDIHYIGVSAILVYGHNLASLRETVLDTLIVGEIRSDCFGGEGVRYIRKAEGAFDSVVALTTQHLQIGRRLISYHYQICIDDIDKVDLVSKDRWTIVVHATGEGKPCEIQISIRAWTHAKDRAVENFADMLMKLTQKR